jgi:GNAT superfamily N-acetyltransferase
VPRAAIEVVPATPERWADLEAVFGAKGACAGCWCMFWRLPSSVSRGNTGDQNREALRALVEAGQEPGLLAYVDGAPAGWCAVGPREAFARLETSRKLRRLDDAPAWAIPCFFVARPYRRQGLMRALIAGAVRYARAHGARLVEGYPLELESAPLRGQRLTGDGGFTGVASAFRAEGFQEAAQVSETQRIMRRKVRPTRG